jgi:hypothetical protein
VYASQDEICDLQDSVLLSVLNWPVVEWFDGDTNHTKWVVGPGIYTAQLGTGFGKLITANHEVSLSTIPQVATQITSPLCAGQNSGALDVYNELDGSLLFSEDSLQAGTHLYSIPYGNGCMYSDTIQIIEPSALEWNIVSQPVLCNSNTNGSISGYVAGGVGPYYMQQNEISNGSFVIDGLGSGSYALQLHDSNGCQKDTLLHIFEPAPFVVVPNYTAAICLNDSVQISWEFSGGTPPFSSENFENYFEAGNYLFTFFDANACESQVNVQISNLPQIQWSANVVHPSLLNNGEIYLNVSNCPNCPVLWSTGDSTTHLSGLVEGNYSFTITDNWGCSTFGQIDLIFNGVSQVENQPASWIYNENGFQNLSNTTLHEVMCFDAAGNMVGYANQVGSMEHFPISNLAVGVYFILCNNASWKVPVYEWK